MLPVSLRVFRNLQAFTDDAAPCQSMLCVPRILGFLPSALLLNINLPLAQLWVYYFIINMSDICLVFPRDPSGHALTSTLADGESLGIGYIASSLRNAGYSVKVINGEVFNIQNEELLSKILEINPKMVGFSPVAINMTSILQICNEIKMKNKDIHVTLGGHHATFAARDILMNELSVDSIVIGNGEKTIVELAQAIFANSKNLQIIKGIAFRVKNEVIITEERQTEKIDAMAFPARDTLEEIISKTGKREARLLTSRGCSNHCVFCTTPSFYKSGWEGHSAERVIEEINSLIGKYQIEHFWITDDNFIIPTSESRDRAREIAQLIIENKFNITFRILCRADSFGDNEQLISLLRRSGMTIAYIGLESGDPQTILQLGKRVSIEQNRRVVHLLSKHGVCLQTGFIMFTPYVTIEGLQNNANFLAQVGELYRFFPLTRAVDVFPGSKLIVQLVEDGLLSSDYNYKSNHIDYSFKYPYIQDMLLSITKCYDEETIKYDNRLLALKIRRLPSVFQNHKENRDILTFVTQEFQKLNDVNYSFFIELLERKGILEQSKLNKMNVERKNKVKEIYNRLNSIPFLSEGR